MNDNLIVKKISYSNDPDLIVPWEVFQTRSMNALKRMLYKDDVPRDEWQFGISYKLLSRFREYDLWSVKGLGNLTYERCLSEIKFLFEQLDSNPGFFDLATEESENLSNERVKASNLGSKRTRVRAPESDLYKAAQNLLDLQNAVLDTYHRNRIVDDRTLDILCGRNLALAIQLISLEELGMRHGITRERVRQIAKKYENIREEHLRDSNTLIDASIEIIAKSNSYEDCLAQLQTSGLSPNGDIDPYNIYFISYVFCSDDYFEKISLIIDEAYKRYSERSVSENKLMTEIKSFRNKLGLIDLNMASNSLTLDSDSLKELILDVYPRSIFTNNLALARTSNLDTTFENTLFKQLLVSDNLSPDELIVGLARHASYRGVALSADLDSLRSLVQNLAGKVPSVKVLMKNTIERAELSATDSWLIDIFRDSPRGYLHRNDLMEAAIAEGYNYSTIGVYLLKNPIIRSYGEAVYSLVGTQINAQEIENYANMQRLNVSKTIVSFEFQASNIRLTVVPNINSIGGVIFAPRALKEMLRGLEFESGCSCRGLRSEQKVKITTANFLTGFTAMFKHAMSAHQFALGSEFPFFIDFDNHTVTFLATI